MKKRIMALLVAGVMLFAIAGCSSSSSSSSDDSSSEETTEEAEEEAEEVTFDLESEYEVDTSYDYYTIFEYTIEGFDPMVVLVCKNAAGTEYNIQCTFYGDAQNSTVEVDGDEMTVTADLTGFMQTDSPLIVEEAEELGVWASID